MVRHARQHLQLSLLVFCAALSAQPSDPISPSRVFKEVRQIWAAEGGRTWGRSLAGPLLLVDPDTRKVWASEADGENQLRNKDGLFVGTLPKSVGVANTAMEWAGKRWSMVILPLPEKALERRVLLIHESWHRIQPSLGLDVQDLPNGHLDKLEGRYWLKLEWRALAKALEAGRVSRRHWVAAALACRTRRQSLFPDAAEAERSLELAEGLAEYTGIHVAGAKSMVLAKLRNATGPFARSFAYVSGPAYGLLLDGAAPGWVKRVRRATDLSVILQESYHLPAATLAESEATAAGLGGRELHVREEAEDKARQHRLELATDPLIKGPTLRVPGPFRIQFNPSNTERLDGGAAYHPTATYFGAWGRLEVTGGSLRFADGSGARVSAPADPKANPLTGPGWTLELTPGWILLAIEPAGCFQLVPEKKEK
jgi:hypothetical protein